MPSWKATFTLCAALFLCACSGNTDDTDTQEQPSDCPDTSTMAEPYLVGTLYTDADSADQSVHLSSFDASADTLLSGVSVDLIGADGTQETTSCDEGTFAFSNLADGTYVLAPDHPDSRCLQRNCPQRFPQAIAEGEITIVTMGDSVPVVGDDPMFPTRLATLLEPLATVDNRNVAVGGTLSTDWLPGTTNFESKLGPNIEDADVIIISVGGNDIMGMLDIGAISNPDQAVADAYELLEEITENIDQIMQEIHSRNPDVDVVYCLYVDYGMASRGLWGIAANFLPEGTIAGILETARSQVPDANQNVVLADLFGASKAFPDSLDSYLYDDLHFNDKGQTVYAEEIFRALGGVLIGDNPLAGEPTSPLNVEPSYSYAP